jgi:hypothetical protein
MKLFEDKHRTRQQPMKRGERLYSFYDESGRAGYDEFRSKINSWLGEFPETDQRELVQRMSKGSDGEFQAALTELLTHATLRKLGFDLSVHPAVTGTTKRPDFGILKNTETAGLVEVTTTNVAESNRQKENREAVIYNAIDTCSLPPGCLLGYELIAAGNNSPKTATLVQSIESWAREAAEEAKKNGPISRRFKLDDWEFELDLFAVGSDEKYDKSIGIMNGGAGWIAPHLDLRKALELKSKRYGNQGLPFLVVVADGKGQLFGADNAKTAITEAVMGDEVVESRVGEEARLARANNGFWRGAIGPKNKHVSGVLLFPDAGIWGLRSEKLQPILAINPWADHPLPESLKALPHFEAEKDKWVHRDGGNIADLLELPDPWPPAD